jgi:general L-amino acid transport system substrate-binding protein
MYGTTRFLAAALLTAAATAPALAGATLDAVKQRGELVCGVHTGRAGFALADSQGKWGGFDIDFCRAVATAVLGDANKVKFLSTTGSTRITALQAGEIDLLSRNTTWTLTRDASLGLSWVGINLFDGQAFLTRKNLKVNIVKELSGATICVDSGSTTEKNLAEYFAAKKLDYKPIVFEQNEATLEAFRSGRCQAMTGDATALTIARANNLGDPEQFVLLPEVISKEPLGPAVRRGDEDWTTIVKWVLYAMIEAEEMGVGKANIDQLRAESKNPAIQRMVGTGEDTGRLLKLDKDWSYRIIKQVGNYGESFDANLGARSALKMERGLNDLWTRGGLIYAPPVR